MKRYNGEGANSDRRETVEGEYRRMMSLKEEVDAQLGSVSLTEALYEDRENGFHGRLGKDKSALARSDA